MLQINSEIPTNLMSVKRYTAPFHTDYRTLMRARAGLLRASRHVSPAAARIIDAATAGRVAKLPVRQCSRLPAQTMPLLKASAV